LPELVEHNVNGHLFEVDNVAAAARGITALADNRGQWASMGAASLARVRAHSLADTIQRYAGLYWDLQAYPYRLKAKPANIARSQEQRVVYR
jgi:glycosyltransferase involved in cell wall biosynthesis